MLDAIHYPGASHMGYISSFLHSLGGDFLKLRPNQNIIVAGNSDSYDTHIQATMADDNTFVLIYSASDSVYSVNLSKLSGLAVSGIWYNPRTNKYLIENSISITDKRKIQEFDPPGELGAGNDWVLVLRDAKTINNYIINR